MGTESARGSRSPEQEETSTAERREDKNHEGNAPEFPDPLSESAVLLELSRMLNSMQDLDAILNNVLLTAMGRLLIPKGLVLIETSAWRFDVRIAKGIEETAREKSFVLPVDWRTFFLIDELDAVAEPEIRRFRDFCAGYGLHAIIPVVLQERLAGVLCFGRKSTAEPFTPSDRVFLHSLAEITGVAINNALTIESLRLTNRRLDAKVQEMNTLFELSREMNATFDEQRILRVLAYTLMGQLRAMRYAVFLADETRMRPVLLRLTNLQENDVLPDTLREVGAPLSLQRGREPRNETEKWLAAAGIHAVVPLRSADRVCGLLCVGERLGGEPYGETDLAYLSGLADITIAALENARMVREMVVKRELERDLLLARSIQNGLLPKSLPQPEGYEIAAINEPSLQVGGDYYDVITLSDHEYVLGIGDVAGKGVPASLLMANVQAALRIIAPLRLPMDEATRRLNALVFSNTEPDTFITFFWGLLDTRAHTFTYVNAGHNPPHLFHTDGRHRSLDAGGLILGVVDEPFPYETETVEVLPGDILVAFTDGVSEAFSPEMKEYGTARLERLVLDKAGSSARDILESIRRDVLRHSSGMKQADDITLLVVGRASSD
ncbi:MAG: SpoIIE family protein phosphatase [Bacteroidota bacterium]|nr:SpoIIE family protein phosphatase [Bacteroidota bacterium]